MMVDFNTQDSIERMLIHLSARRGGEVSKSTKETFFVYLKRYCLFCGKTPDELIEDRENDWDSKNRFTRRSHEEKLLEFVKYLNNEGYSSNTVSTAIAAVRSFYRTNYLPMTGLNFPHGRSVREYKIPSKEELTQVIDMVRMPWHKVFMVLTKDCGIPLQDMLALKVIDGSPIYGSIKDQIKKGRVPIHINIRRKKTLFKYDTFLGEDSFEVLNDYPKLIAKVLTGKERLIPRHKSTIQEAMKDLQNEMGWKETFSPYSLRKWFRTQLTLDDMNDLMIEAMMGHALDRVKAAYFVPPTQKLIEMYKKHYPALKL